MNTSDIIVGIILAIAILGGFLAAGFAAGYRGTWKHTTAVVSIIMGLFLFPQIASLIVFHHAMGLNKVLGGVVGMEALIITGSLIGALARRVSSTKHVLVFHIGIAGGVFVLLEIFSRLGEGNWMR